ncbi:MAG TPA: CehA/McbA family metallohydrolase [Gemmataceae bacterium]|nr:CehA/McbA family metallohydrolase [Gemmataceae bacterium]
MRKLLPAFLSALLLGVGVFVSAQPRDARVKVRLRLIDAANGKAVAGIVHVSDADKNTVELPGLFDRMAGMTKDLPGVHWYVVSTEGADTTLPVGKYHLQALSGLETGRAQLDVEVRADSEISLKLPFLFRPEDAGLVAGNTHLHLRGFSLDKADQYVKQIPSADRLRVLFLSYLERHKDDESYITNKYPIGDLPKLSAAGVLVNNGEEHRHNFQAFGEGYGHVMFLNIKQLVKPVSLGPGITGEGNDDVPLRTGIDNAKQQGGTVLWCHNTFGVEDVLCAITRRFDALNVFDGSRTGKYEDNYYRYLNIGLRMPISTGTDWFMYDQSRVYAHVPGKLTIASWLDALKSGRCQATNGPLLSLTVDGKAIGDVIDLKEPRTIKIAASAVGRHPVQKLQLVQNGRVIKTQLASPKDPERASLTHEVRVDGPAWFAVRIDSDAKNEFQKTLFAHTSPVYVDFQGKRVFDLDAGVALLKQVEEGRAMVRDRAKFSGVEAEQRIVALYDAAAQDLRDRLNKR